MAKNFSFSLAVKTTFALANQTTAFLVCSSSNSIQFYHPISQDLRSADVSHSDCTTLCLVTRTKISLVVHYHCLLVLLQTCPDSDGRSFSLHFDCPLTKNRSIGNSEHVSGGRQREISLPVECHKQRHRRCRRCNRPASTHMCPCVLYPAARKRLWRGVLVTVLCSDTALIYC